MGRPADRRIDRSGERLLGDRGGAAPAGKVGLAVQRAVAGEGELAAGEARRALIDDVAHAGGEGRVTHAVENHLGDRALAVVALIAGLVIGRAREALDRLRAGRRIALEYERGRGRIRTVGDWDLLVDLQRLIGADRA